MTGGSPLRTIRSIIRRGGGTFRRSMQTGKLLRRLGFSARQISGMPGELADFS